MGWDGEKEKERKGGKRTCEVGVLESCLAALGGC